MAPCSSALVGQIVPPGAPWPANAADYDKFSQTTRRTHAIPEWATPAPTVKHRLPEVDDRLPKINATPDHKHWSRPTIVFHELYMRNITKEIKKEKETTAMPITLPEIALFTSAPINKSEMVPNAILTDTGVVGVANLLPESITNATSERR